MQDILQKISSYNIFNYLFPGIVFTEVAKEFLGVHLPPHGVVELFFIYYFVGLVTSRIGSLALEPLVKRLKIVSQVPYTTFVTASSKDPKLELLSETNNTYRTLAAGFLILLLSDLARWLVRGVGLELQPRTWGTLGLVGLATLFVLSFRKQTRFVADRARQGE